MDDRPSSIRTIIADGERRARLAPWLDAGGEPVRPERPLSLEEAVGRHLATALDRGDRDAAGQPGAAAAASGVKPAAVGEPAAADGAAHGFGLRHAADDVASPFTPRRRLRERLGAGEDAPDRAATDAELVGERTRQDVGSAFGALSRTLLANNPRTLEDLVREMMRPMLREWLDANLTEIVERQVRQEIDRLARGR